MLNESVLKLEKKIKDESPFFDVEIVVDDTYDGNCMLLYHSKHGFFFKFHSKDWLGDERRMIFNF